jgi:ankyrin repeat protein
VDARDQYGNTPLWQAVFHSNGRGELIGLLLRSGASPNAANDSGISPVQLAQTIANYNVKQYFGEGEEGLPVRSEVFP